MKFGFEKLKLKKLTNLNKVKILILNKLKKITCNKNINFENYHKHISDQYHPIIQWELAKYFRENKLHLICFKDLEHLLQKYFGQSILIQKNPFLRIARPFKKEDNIGYHKDTMYGQSPFEMSVHIPFTTLGKKSCLRFAKYSHLINEKKIKFIAETSNIKKNSRQHKLGKPYMAKKIIANTYKEKPLPLKYGEFVFFSPAVIHGQEINLDKNKTRFSFDTRVTSKFFPIKFKKNNHNSSYIEYSKSDVEILAKKYFSNQK